MAAPRKKKQPLTMNAKSKLDFVQPDKNHWKSFEDFFNTCVKNGTPVMMASCKAHVQSLGHLTDQSKWLEGLVDFGIKMEQ